MKLLHRKTVLCLMFILCLLMPALQVYAVEQTTDFAAEAEKRKSEVIESNMTEDWPAGPSLGAEAAILMDADTGAILYSKNIHEHLYPASTTKLLTALLAKKHGNLSDMITFSYDAVFGVPADGSNMGMDVGESITLEECLYGILTGSANEAASAAAEYTSGSVEAFVELMNKEAAEMGCVDSHFSNANGLHDEKHYTSAYDLAMISRVFFADEMLSSISNTSEYHMRATAHQPDDFNLYNKHKLVNGEVKYDGILGGKTGYTANARQTLVTCARRNGMKLIAVIMKEEDPHQFSDTVSLFDYGFSNFQHVDCSASLDERDRASDFFYSGSDIFGSSEPLITVEEGSCVTLPQSASISETKTTVTYHDKEKKEGDTLSANSAEPRVIAVVHYTWHGADVGEANVVLNRQQAEVLPWIMEDTGDPGSDDETGYESEIYSPVVTTAAESTESPENEDNTIFINIKIVLVIVIVISSLIISVLLARTLLRSYHFHRRF
ncbi:MAG: D-alanyl-D-alanine carboxypeptidase [Lachnospiraceae bacterium]|nr:D-alanyl-D-alanine carboxypeptidase [Lachnospiraceae bacterium]